MEVSYLEHNGYIAYEETEEDRVWTMYCDYMDCNEFNLCGNLMTYKEYAESVTYTNADCQVTKGAVK